MTLPLLCTTYHYITLTHPSQVPQLDAQQLRTAATEDAQFMAFEAQLAREKAVSLNIAHVSHCD